MKMSVIGRRAVFLSLAGAAVVAAFACTGSTAGSGQPLSPSGASSGASTSVGGSTASPAAGKITTHSLPPAQLSVVKTPDGGTFVQGAQVSYKIVVTNPATAGLAEAATNVALTDALPGNGGLIWVTASTTQGTCTNPIVGNSLSCLLGDIVAGGSVTVIVTSTATTPDAACQSQPNPAANATTDRGLSAQDSGSLSCTPPTPGVAHGCTPGFWKTHANNPPWGSYLPSQTVGSVFVVPAAFQAETLLDALQGGGGSGLNGKIAILLRAATAALLNADNGNPSYPIAKAQVISQTNAAIATGNQTTINNLASQLDTWNNQCDLR